MHCLLLLLVLHWDALPSRPGVRHTACRLGPLFPDSHRIGISEVTWFKGCLHWIEYLNLGLLWLESTGYILSSNMATFPKRPGAMESDLGNSGRAVPVWSCRRSLTCLFLSLPHSPLKPASDFWLKDLRVRPLLAALPVTPCGSVWYPFPKIALTHQQLRSYLWPQARSSNWPELRQPGEPGRVVGQQLSSWKPWEAEQACVIDLQGVTHISAFCAAETLPLSLKDGSQEHSCLIVST